MNNTQTSNSRNTANFNIKLFTVVLIGVLMSQTIAIGQAIMSDVFWSGAVLATATPQRMFTATNEAMSASFMT